MKSLGGKSFNIQSALIGRVEAIKEDDSGISHLLETDSTNETYALLRSGSPIPGIFIHPAILLAIPIKFSEGDILRLNPDGRCQLIYQQSVSDNAIIVTEQCNSNCIMCPQPPKSHSPSLLNETLELIKLITPSPVALGLTGGEPTCAFNDLIFIIKEIRRYHPDTFIQLLTNARLLNDFSKAKAICDIAKDKITFCTPLYSDDDTTHDKLVHSKGAFWQSLEGIFNLGRLGANIEIRTVVLAQNYHRLPQWAEFIYRNIPFVSHVAIMGIEQIGLAQKNFEDLYIDPVDYADSLFSCVKKIHQRGMPVSIFNHQLCTLPKSLWRFSVKSISSWKIRFNSICNVCSVKDDCGGFFFASQTPSRGIHAINSLKGATL